MNYCSNISFNEVTHNISIKLSRPQNVQTVINRLFGFQLQEAAVQRLQVSGDALEVGGEGRLQMIKNRQRGNDTGRTNNGIVQKTEDHYGFGLIEEMVQHYKRRVDHLDC